MTSAGARLELPPSGEVHVWHADLALPDTRWRELAATLAPDERERAARLRAEPHRRRFVAGRGLLRAILGAYLGLEPGRIRLAYGATGKPRLAGTEAPLTFNLAHADEVAVCAVAAGFPVGVDVERLRPLPDMAEVAACCLSARERAFLASLRGAERVDAFFRAWTRKEAWLKAVGRGLAFGPERVEVTLAAGEPARLVAVAGCPDAPHRWSLHDLPLRRGHAAALATSQLVRRCSWRRWAWESVPWDSARGESPPRGSRGSGEHTPPGWFGRYRRRSEMGRILQGFWPGISTATEVASLTAEGAPGGHLCVVCRTATGALFGYEMDGVDGGEPTSEAIVRFFTVGDAVAWMRRHGFPRESIEAAFLDPPRGVTPRREGNGAARPRLNGSRG